MTDLIARNGQLLERHLLDVKRDITKGVDKKYFSNTSDSSKISLLIEAISLAGFLHDIGKGEISIQEALKKGGRLPKSHAALSFPFFAVALRKVVGVDPFEDEEIAVISFALLSHHSVPHFSLERNLTTKLDLKTVSFCPETFELLKSYDLPVTPEEVSEQLKNWVEGNRNNNLDFQLTTGLLNNKIPPLRELFIMVYDSLVKADWASASDNKLRPRIIKPALSSKSSKLIDPQRSKVHSFVHNGTQFSKNIFLEMPTGFGKTYIGTSYALKTNRKRVIYTLPITTIIEDVYDRLSKFLGKRNVEWYTSRQLAIKITDDENYDQKNYDDAKYLNAPCIVTTLDQILMAWLNFDRYPLKEYPLYDACIILDEPQLYSPFMLFLFAKLYPEYQEKTNLVVMSATIPDFLRNAIKDRTTEPFHKEVEEIFSRYNRTFISLATLQSSIIKNDLLSNDTKAILKQACQNRKKVVIVVNTVLRAQKIYELISEMPANKFLFHARFALKDKRRKLFELKRLLNKPGPTIVVSTQIIEAGVNVDFDLMIRELAPFDSIVQSAGRVHRNRYDNSIERGVIHLFDLASESSLPYQKHQIETTLTIFRDNWPEKQKNEFLYYERLQRYWYELNNWIIKDESEAQQILKHRNELSLFGAKISEESVNLRNGYLTVSAVPENYVDNVLELLKERNETKDIWKRKKLSARIESFMIEVPYFAKASPHGKFCDYISSINKEQYPWLNMLSLKYDAEKGLLPEEDNMI